jgi:hypothetical protein
MFEETMSVFFVIAQRALIQLKSATSFCKRCYVKFGHRELLVGSRAFNREVGFAPTPDLRKLTLCAKNRRGRHHSITRSAECGGLVSPVNFHLSTPIWYLAKAEIKKYSIAP